MTGLQRHQTTQDERIVYLLVTGTVTLLYHVVLRNKSQVIRIYSENCGSCNGNNYLLWLQSLNGSCHLTRYLFRVWINNKNIKSISSVSSLQPCWKTWVGDAIYIEKVNEAPKGVTGISWVSSPWKPRLQP